MHASENARAQAIMGPPVPAVGGPQDSAYVCVHMHSPAGGAHPSASMLPPIAEPKLDVMGLPGGSAYACPPQHTDIQMYTAHLRQHEYPQYMDFHMRQGMSHAEAHARWESYEHMRVTQRIRDMRQT